MKQPGGLLNKTEKNLPLMLLAFKQNELDCLLKSLKISIWGTTLLRAFLQDINDLCFTRISRVTSSRLVSFRSYVVHSRKVFIKLKQEKEIFRLPVVTGKIQTEVLGKSSKLLLRLASRFSIRILVCFLF